MKRTKLILLATTFILMLLPILAYARDFMSVGESEMYNAPKALLRTDSSLWDQDFKDNPALLDPRSDLEFIVDMYYTGSTTDVSAYFNLGSPTGILYYGFMDADYWAHNTGADIGFIKKLSDRSSLGFVMSYNWEGLDGDGSFSHYADARPVGLAFNFMNGTLDTDLSSNTFALSVLYDIDFSEDLSLGAGIGYAYINNRVDYDVSGSGAAPLVGPENLSIDKEMTFDYHCISPVFGISVRPIDALVINSSVSADISLGSVERTSDYFDDIYTVNVPGFFPTGTYTERLDSNDVFILDIAYTVDGAYEIIPEELSLPFFFDVTYGAAHWAVDGAVSGYFTPGVYLGSFQGPGTIEYGNNTEYWSVSAGVGVDYAVGGFDLSALVEYSHLDLKNSFYMDNYVVSAVSVYGGPTTVGGLTAMSQDMGMILDVISFELGVSREFSEKFRADFSARYDIEWGKMSADMWYTSPYDYALGGIFNGGSFDVGLSDEDVTHTLTLSTYLAYIPVENLTLSLEGMVGIPLNETNYNLSGDCIGTVNPIASWRYGFDGPSSMDMSLRSWSYGGMFNIEYAF